MSEVPLWGKQSVRSQLESWEEETHPLKVFRVSKVIRMLKVVRASRSNV